jgi:hypothetical protein
MKLQARAITHLNGLRGYGRLCFGTDPVIALPLLLWLEGVLVGEAGGCPGRSKTALALFTLLESSSHELQNSSSTYLSVDQYRARSSNVDLS